MFPRAARLPPPPPTSPTHASPPHPATPCSSPPDPMTPAAPEDPPSSVPLGPLFGRLPPHLFRTEVLRRLGPMALASLAGAGRGCAAAVASTTLMKWAKRARTTAPEHFRRLCVQSACSHAARGGNREVLEWLHNTGCPWDTVTCWMAAMAGHVEMVKWLHNHGCPWDTLTCSSAARSGHLRVLQWAREHHCPWNAETTWLRAGI